MRRRWRRRNEHARRFSSAARGTVCGKKGRRAYTSCECWRYASIAMQMRCYFAFSLLGLESVTKAIAAVSSARSRKTAACARLQSEHLIWVRCTLRGRNDESLEARDSQGELAGSDAGAF